MREDFDRDAAAAMAVKVVLPGPFEGQGEEVEKALPRVGEVSRALAGCLPAEARIIEVTVVRMEAACEATPGKWGNEGHWVAVLPLCPAGDGGSLQAYRGGTGVPVKMAVGQAAVFRGHVETRLVSLEATT